MHGFIPVTVSASLLQLCLLSIRASNNFYNTYITFQLVLSNTFAYLKQKIELHCTGFIV